MDGADAPKPVSNFGLLRMAFGLTAASLNLTQVNERRLRVVGQPIRTGLDRRLEAFGSLRASGVQLTTDLELVRTRGIRLFN